jgi:hypothetical protein
MTMTFKNEFHGTQATATPIETGETIHNEKYAEFTEKQLQDVAMTLCGIKDCTCCKYETYCTAEDGISYLVMQK